MMMEWAEFGRFLLQVAILLVFGTLITSILTAIYLAVVKELRK